MVLAIAWAGTAFAQDASSADFPDYTSEMPSDESYVADPHESFIVEHSGAMAAAAPRREPPPADRCREYATDEDGSYGRGYACPEPDGSWRIVSGPDELMTPRTREESRRARAPAGEYPDYADEAPTYREEARPTRRFRLDWNAWGSSRRESARPSPRASARAYRDRYYD
jgi:hypothetical protein